MNFRIILSCSIILLSTACVSAPSLKGNYQSDISKNILSDKIYSQAQKCWEKESSVWSDGIKVTKRTGTVSDTISANRYAFDIGHLSPFIIVDLNSEGTKTSIKVREGDKSLFANNNYASDVERWIQNNYTCNLQ